MLKSILIATVILFLLAGLTYSQDSFDGNIHEPGTDEGIYNPPYNPDWQDDDVLVYDHSGLTSNVTKRTLDMEYCEENGKLYIALCYNLSATRGIRIYSSGDNGSTWTLEVDLPQNTYYITGLSMKVEQRWPISPDSVRVHIFYTRSTSANNANATLRFVSFRPDASLPGFIEKEVATPSAGNQLRWPSAYSNGQYDSLLTNIGCVVGEYNNAGNDCISIRKYWMQGLIWNFTGQTLITTNVFWPSAVYKNNPSGVDSVYIAVEWRTATGSQIGIIKTRAFAAGSWPFLIVTPSVTGVYYRKPCLAIPQKRTPYGMVITYTQNASSTAPSGRGRYSSSFDGILWAHNNLGSSYTTEYTWVASDSNTTNPAGENCTFLWGDYDSLNVRRSTILFAGGTTYYKRASNNVSNYIFPVCAVNYDSSGFRRSVFAYWRFNFGNQDVYSNSENLPPIGITNTNGIANTYSLSQNFPNPFNPITTIKFSIPHRGLVKLVVFDVLGKEVAMLVNDEQTAGNYEVTFDASKLTSGVYFYKITSDDFSDVKKMLLVK